MKLKTTIAAAAATVVVIGGVGVGIATAAPTPAPTASPSTSASAPAQKLHHHKNLLARAQHAEATLGGKKGTRVVVFQRGTVTAVTATSVTVKSLDGFSATYVVNGDTTVRQRKTAKAITDVKTAAKVRVLAAKAGDVETAKRIVLAT